MKNKRLFLTHLAYGVLKALGHALARFKQRCYGISFTGFRIFLVPGVVSCDISFRAGGSGRIHRS